MPQDVVQLFHRARELRRKGRAREAIELLDAAQHLAGEDLNLLVPVLSDRGLAERQEGDCEAARRTYAELVSLFEEGEGLNPVIFAAVLDNFGFVERECGDLAAAGEHHTRAVKVLRGLDEPGELAHALTGLAIVQKDLGLLQQARISITEALLLAPAENRQLVAYIRSVYGLVFQILREWTNARREFVHALIGFRAVGDGENAAVALHNLATVEYERRRTGTAVRLLRRSMAINDQLKITVGMANDLRRLALYAADAGALPQARALLLRALRAARRMGDRVLEAWCQLDLARVAVHMNQTRETLKRASAAWSLAGEVAVPFLTYEVLMVRGVAWWRRGRLERAVDDFEAAVAALDRLREGAMTEELSLRFFGEDSDAHANLVQVAIERGDVEAAWQWAERTRGRELNRRIRRSTSLTPRNVPSELVAREHDLLRRLDVSLAALESQASSSAAEDVDAAMAALDEIWDAMKGLDAEYVLMRTGDDISFADLRCDLAGWSTEQSR